MTDTDATIRGGLSRVALLVVLAAAGSLLLTGTAAADCDPISEIEGNGTETDPFVITTAEELQQIDDIVTCREDELDDVDRFHYVLGNDIDAAETQDWEGGAGFDPIGDRYSAALTGSFDGQGHTISDLHIARPADDHVGLFAYSEGRIENFRLENVTIVGNEEVGAVVGRNDDDGAVGRISATGEVTGTARRTGGLVGRNSGEVSASSMEGTIESTEREVGGIAGQNRGAIDKSYFVGSVGGEREIGGIIGDNRGSLRAAFAAGEAEGERRVGGVVGDNDGAVREVHSLVDVLGERDVAGLVGTSSGTVSRSYAAGTVDDARRSAGAVATNEGIVEFVYWDINRTEHGQAFGDHTGKREDVTGLEPWELTGENATEHTALDFDSPWTMTDGYPRLEWEDDRDVPDEVYDLEVQTEPPETPAEEESTVEEDESDDDGFLPVSPIVLLAAVVLLAAIVGGGFYGYQQLERGAEEDADARDGQPRRRRRSR